MQFDRKRDDPWFAPPRTTIGELDEAPHVPAPVLDAPSTPGDPTALLPWMDDVKSIVSAPEHDETKRSEHHSAAPTRVAEAGASAPFGKPGGPRFDPRFVPMAHGSIKEAVAPSALTLPAGIVKGLDEAWARTQAAGHDERGGNIVKTYRHGNYEVRHGGGDADNDEWMPDRSDVRAGQDFIGTYHTHDYTHDKKPYDSGTFSDQDVANMADLEDRMKLVRSGKETYMLARTKEFDAMAKQSDSDPEKHAEFQREMRDTYNKAYEKVYQGDDKRHQEALEAGVKAAAQKYHLLYYKGQGANLKRSK